METKASEEAVWLACEQLEADGRKVTGRAIQAEIGGSLSTISTHLKSWQARDKTVAAGADNIPAGILEPISRALRQCALDATERFRAESVQSAERESEVLQALVESESRIASLENDLLTACAQIGEVQQNRDKESAVADEKILGLRETAAKLEHEKQQLTQAGENARIELSKVQSELARADKVILKTEATVLDLEQRVTKLSQSTVEAQKDQAVAESNAQGLLDRVFRLEKQLENAEAKIAALESERVRLTHELSAAALERCKAESIGEQLQFRLQKSTALNNILRQELTFLKLPVRYADTGEDESTL